MTEEEDVDDRHDVVVDSWMKILNKGQLVEFEEMLKADMAGRVVDTDTVNESDIHCIESRELGSSSNPTLKDLIELVDNMKNDMGARFKVIEDKLETQDNRFAMLEGIVKEKSGEHEKSGDQEEGEQEKEGEQDKEGEQEKSGDQEEGEQEKEGEQDKEGEQEKEGEMVNEGLTIDDAAASEPQGNESDEKEKSGENSKVIEAADEGVKKKRKRADRTVVQEKPSRPVTRSRKN